MEEITTEIQLVLRSFDNVLREESGLNGYWPICGSYKHRGSCQKNDFLEYPIPVIPDDSEKQSGMDRVLPKIIGLGRVSGNRQSLLAGQPQ